MNNLLTVNETAERLGVSPKTVYRMIDAGQLRHIRLRGIIRLEPKEIDRLIKNLRRGG